MNEIDSATHSQNAERVRLQTGQIWDQEDDIYLKVAKRYYEEHHESEEVKRQQSADSGSSRKRQQCSRLASGSWLYQVE